jgi:hypothetical protein
VSGQRVVRNHAGIVLAPHKGPRGSPRLRGSGLLGQPAIQLRLAAIKVGEIVDLAERLGPEWR